MNILGPLVKYRYIGDGQEFVLHYPKKKRVKSKGSDSKFNLPRKFKAKYDARSNTVQYVHDDGSIYSVPALTPWVQECINMYWRQQSKAMGIECPVPKTRIPGTSAETEYMGELVTVKHLLDLLKLEMGLKKNDPNSYIVAPPENLVAQLYVGSASDTARGDETAQSDGSGAGASTGTDDDDDGNDDASGSRRGKKSRKRKKRFGGRKKNNKAEEADGKTDDGGARHIDQDIDDLDAMQAGKRMKKAMTKEAEAASAAAKKQHPFLLASKRLRGGYDYPVVVNGKTVVYSKDMARLFSMNRIVEKQGGVPKSVMEALAEQKERRRNGLLKAQQRMSSPRVTMISDEDEDDEEQEDNDNDRDDNDDDAGGGGGEELDSDEAKLRSALIDDEAARSYVQRTFLDDSMQRMSVKRRVKEIFDLGNIINDTLNQ